MDYRQNNLVLQYMIQQQTNSVAKNIIPMEQWALQQSLQTVATQQLAWQQRVQQQQPVLIVAIERQPLATKHLPWQQTDAPIATTMFSVAIERLPLATKYLSWQQMVPPIATSIDRCNREATSSNQIFIVAIDGSTYSNHQDSMAIEGPSIAMLLMRGNKVYCNTKYRCQCTYCHTLGSWQQVFLVLQQGKTYCNTKMSRWANLLPRLLWQRLPTKKKCCNFVYRNHFWYIATLLGRCIRGKTLQWLQKSCTYSNKKINRCNH